MACILTALSRVNQQNYAAIHPVINAFMAMSFVIRDCIELPIILCEDRSTTTEKIHSQPSWGLM